MWTRERARFVTTRRAGEAVGGATREDELRTRAGGSQRRYGNGALPAAGATGHLPDGGRGATGGSMPMSPLAYTVTWWSYTRNPR